MIFRYASKEFPSWTIRIFVRWSTSRTSFLFFLSDIFETFFHRMVIKSTISSLSSLLLSHARLTFFLDFSDLRLFSLPLGGLGNVAIIWSSDPHLKHFRTGRSEFLLDELPVEQDFHFYFLIFLKRFSTEWFESPQYVHCALAEFPFSLCLLDPDWLLSVFKYSVCYDERFKHFW